MHALSIFASLACLLLSARIVWLSIAPNFAKIAAALAGAESGSNVQSHYGRSVTLVTFRRDAPRRAAGYREITRPAVAETMSLAA